MSTRLNPNPHFRPSESIPLPRPNGEEFIAFPADEIVIPTIPMLSSLVHNPCSTTIYTIWKETRSAKWTAISALMPVGLGPPLCFVVAQVWRIVSL